MVSWQEAMVKSRRREVTDVEAVTEAAFIELMDEQRRRDEASHESFKVIPRFWATNKTTTLLRLLRSAAESRCERDAPVLSWEELERLRQGLLNEDERLNYEALCRCRRDLKSPAFGAQLSARRFLELPRDAEGRASARDLYHRVDRATCAAKTRAALRRYVRPGANAVLREADLERYVYDLIPDMPPAHAMDEKFQPFYVFTAVRRFMFFLDPRRRGYVRVDDAAASNVALDLLEIFADDSPPPTLSSSSSSKIPPPPPPPPMEPQINTPPTTPTMRLPPASSSSSPVASPPPMQSPSSTSSLATSGSTLLGAAINKSWFFPDTAKRVYADYLELDVDHNGMLSKTEFLHFRGPRGDTRLTKSFVDRVFAEIITYPTENPPLSGHFEPEMDFKTYLDVVLAFENVDQPQALSYFWRLLDVQKTGSLDSFAINFFFRDVIARLREEGFEPPSTADVVDEIFDMVKPQNPRCLTFDDLLRCKQAHTVILMLIDVAGFLAYDNREHLIQGLDDDDF